MAEKRAGTGVWDRLRAQRIVNDHARIEGPLVHLTDKDLQADVREFARHLPDVEYENVLRAARVAKDSRAYDAVARKMATQTDLLVQLTDDEMSGLESARNELSGQYRQILPVVVTVGCAAFLQGHVQASINSASVYARWLQDQFDADGSPLDDWVWRYKLGAANAAPYFAAAVMGAPLALLLNYWVGRRGAITVAAVTILASSLGSAWTQTWWQLLCVRLVNGVGMGVKAVSAPILASEIAFDRWRGSSALMWQLWVAFGIAIGSILNLAIASWCHAVEMDAPEQNQRDALRQILGAPFVPAVVLLVALSGCMESPRYYMQTNTPHYSPSRAYEILLKARKTQLQALGDLYLIHKSVELDECAMPVKDGECGTAAASNTKAGLTYASNVRSGVAYSCWQYRRLFVEKKLKNAVVSTCVVALAQQLCGINIFAFYSNTFFANASNNIGSAMGYSAGFGAVNFVFGLLAVRQIDTWGRRKLMLTTLPLMSLFLAGAALAFINFGAGETNLVAVAVLIYLFAAVYSPSLGPIPFTLASESFPLAQREAGCSVAIAVNLFFAGILTVFYPELDQALSHWGGLAIFAGLNLVALVLVFLLVEETGGYRLEELSMVFAVPKRKFVQFQMGYLGYLWRRFARGRQDEEEPVFYTYASEWRDSGASGSTQPDGGDARSETSGE